MVNVPLGQTVITAGALEALQMNDVLRAIARHAGGDWGDIDSHDQAANNRSLVEGFRLLSAYVDSRGTKFWVITEANRTQTTVLLPEEY